MLAFCNAAVIKALLVVVGVLFSSECREPAASQPRCGLSVMTVSVASAPDTVRERTTTAAPAKPAKPVKITISDEGIKIGEEGQEKLILEVDTEKLGRLEEEVRAKLESIPESLDVVFGGEEDGRFDDIRSSDLVQLGKTIRIERNELVNGDVVTIGSDIIIDGKVTGDVAAIFGGVRLGPEAIVNGEVVSILGNVTRADGAVVRGEVAVIGGRHGQRGIVYPLGPFGEGVFSAGIRIVLFIIGILLLLIVFYFIGDRMGRAGTHVSGAMLKSFGVGLMVVFGGGLLVFILTIILAITIVGIPVAVLLDCSYFALMILGYFVSAYAVGNFLCKKFGIGTTSLYVQALIGLLALAIFGIVASFMAFTPLLAPARIVLRVTSFSFNFAAVLVGVGAFILSKGGNASLTRQGPPVA